MFVDDETQYQYFLLLVDVFSSKVFTEPLKSRSTDDVLTAFKKILLHFQSKIYEIQADRESAFLSKSFQKFLEEQKIVFRSKYGKNKAAIGNEMMYCLLLTKCKFNLYIFNL